MAFSTERKWIEHEDEITRDERVARLEWVTIHYPDSDLGFMVSGGLQSYYILEEMKYCFAYGQFLATSILGAVFIERVLAAELYGAGHDDLERASGHVLFSEALKRGWISQEEFQQINEVRLLRNPIAHFRRPGAEDTLEHQAVQQNVRPYEVVEANAQRIMMAAFRVLKKCAI